jgi:hypothetical protein
MPSAERRSIDHHDLRIKVRRAPAKYLAQTRRECGYATSPQSISSERTNTVIFPFPIELTDLWRTRERKE